MPLPDPNYLQDDVWIPIGILSGVIAWLVDLLKGRDS